MRRFEIFEVFIGDAVGPDRVAEIKIPSRVDAQRHERFDAGGSSAEIVLESERDDHASGGVDRRRLLVVMDDAAQRIGVGSDVECECASGMNAIADFVGRL